MCTGGIRYTQALVAPRAMESMQISMIMYMRTRHGRQCGGETDWASHRPRPQLTVERQPTRDRFDYWGHMGAGARTWPYAWGAPGCRGGPE